MVQPGMVCFAGAHLFIVGAYLIYNYCKNKIIMVRFTLIKYLLKVISNIAAYLRFSAISCGVERMKLMDNRIAQLKASTEAMMDAGVRKTTFYPLIYESLMKTEGKPLQVRRALALEYLLDNVKLEVFPYELLGGSILGMWPVDPEQPSMKM
jgi:hypothetical protein